MRLKEVANKGVYGLWQKCGGFAKEQAIPSTPGIRRSLTEDMSLSGPAGQVVSAGTQWGTWLQAEEGMNKGQSVSFSPTSMDL